MKKEGGGEFYNFLFINTSLNFGSDLFINSQLESNLSNPSKLGFDAGPIYIYLM